MTSTTIDNEQLLRMSQEELDNLFRQTTDPGPVPAGEADGTVIFAADRTDDEIAAKLAHLVAWRGKVFDPDRGELLNKIGPASFHAVRAQVYIGDSWLDGRPAVILDYSRTSLLAHWVRDEIRQVAPGLYLGIVYWEQKRILNFSLQFPPAPAAD